MIKKAKKRFLKGFASVRKRFNTLNSKLKQYKKIIFIFVERKPLTSFFVLLGALFVAIVISNIITTPESISIEESKLPKKVNVYNIGSAPEITVQAQITKSGVVQITALTSGVVNKIHYFEGKNFKKGNLLLSMSSNYAGSNSLSLARQLAGAQFQNINDTYDTQKEVVKKQKEIAEKTDSNSDDLREIAKKSIDETKNLISINEDILNTLDSNIASLTASGSDADLLLSTKQLKSQFVSSTNAAKTALRTAEQSSPDDKPQAEIANLQKDLTLKQLEIQEKQLDLSLEVSRIQLAIARVNEQAMFPTAPFNGTVQRVFVKENQSVTPGTPLLLISQKIEEDPITAMALVSHDIAKRISDLELSTLHIGDKTYEEKPSFVSTEAVSGASYAVYYPIPDSLNQDLINDGYISVDIPIGYYDTSNAAIFIPVDAVYQTRDQSYTFVAENGTAAEKNIQLGSVFGSFVEVIDGLQNGDQVILDRNVIAKDLVEIN